MSLCDCFRQPKEDVTEEGSLPLSSVPVATTSSTSTSSNGHKSKTEVVPEELPEPNRVFWGMNDGIIWNCPLAKHSHGEFSFAVAQGNTVMEDCSEVKASSSRTYVGVFDGHGGSQHSTFLGQHMFRIVQDAAERNGGLSADALVDSFADADSQLLQMVRENWLIQPSYASSGSCALLAVLEASTLYVASVGDSRAVLGSAESMSPVSLVTGAVGPTGRRGRVRAVEVSREHNANQEEMREEVLQRCPDDPTILQEKGGMWRVKGIIQVTRSLGDFYLKYSEFQCTPLSTKFRLPEGLSQPALISTPSVLERKISPLDRFVILASDGLWENMSNQEAVDIVSRYPRAGIARRLVKLALIRAAKRRMLTYGDLKGMRPGRRREIHDDTSCVVLFLDQVAPQQKRLLEEVSLASFGELEKAPDDVELGYNEEDTPDDFEFKSSFLGSGVLRPFLSLE